MLEIKAKSLINAEEGHHYLVSRVKYQDLKPLCYFEKFALLPGNDLPFWIRIRLRDRQITDRKQRRDTGA